MKNWILHVISMITVALIAVQCSSVSLSQTGPPQVKVIEVQSHVAMADANGAVYFKVLNEGISADVLLGVESDIGTAELHETKMDKNDIMWMGPISNIEIPAGGSVNLEPGGKHVMFVNLKQNLTPGEKIRLSLNFQKSGPITIEAEVRKGNRDLSLEHHSIQHSLRDK